MTRGKRLLFTIIITLLSLVLLNAIAKKFAHHPAEKAYEDVYVGHPTRIHALKPGAQATIPVGLFGPYFEQWRESGATYDVQINPQGYRDRPFGTKQSPRVIALGDSCTFGWDVEADETWPKTLEKLLRQQGYDAEVLNMSVPGYSTHQALLLLPEVWALEPDVLIVAYGRNDELDTAYSPTQHARNRTDAELMPGDRIAEPPAPSITQRLKETALYKAGRQILFRYKSAPKPDEAEAPQAEEILHRVPLAQYGKNLRQMIKQAKEREIKVILVNIGGFFEEYRKAMLEVGRSENVSVLNTFPLLFSKVNAIKEENEYADCRKWLIQWLGEQTLNESPGGWLWFSTDFGHPNACGHQVIAEALLPLLPSFD